jgi:hypothetical protein
MAWLLAGIPSGLANGTPLAIAPPPDVTVECGAPTDPDATGRPALLRYCGSEACISFADVTAGACPSVIERVWLVADDCGSSASATQRVTVADTTPPSLTGIPASLTLVCGEDVPAAPAVSASDGCAALPGSTRGLVLHYAFDADEGAFVRDLSGNGRHATASGARFEAQGRLGGALRFDGVNDYVLGSDAGFPAGSHPRSVSWWFHADELRTNAITMMIEYGSNAYNRLSAWGIDGRQNRPRTYYTTFGPDFWSATRIQTGRWYHAVYTYGGAAYHNFYIDGQSSYGGSMMNVPNTSLAGVLRLGWRTNEAPFKGMLDEVMVYDRELSAGEVHGLFARPNAGTASVEMTETREGDCPGRITRTWTATDACGNRTSGVQTVSMEHAAAGGSVWVDLNANGLPDEDLRIQGLNGVRVRLSRVADGATSAVATAVSGSIADRRGQYVFDGLAAGTYCLDADPDTVPSTLDLPTTLGCATIVVASAYAPFDAHFGYMSSDPLAVELLSFTARRVSGAVALEWATAAEIDSMGFRLYRSESLEGPRLRITPALIEGAGTGQGRAYAVMDAENLAPGTYFYWLEDVEFDGDTALHGPAVATVGAAADLSECAFVLQTGGVCSVRASVLAAAGLPVREVEADRLRVAANGEELAVYATAAGRPMRDDDFVLVCAAGLEAPVRVSFAMTERGSRMEERYVGPAWGEGPVWEGEAAAGEALPFEVSPEVVRCVLSGFGDGVWLFDVTDPKSPRVLVGAETMMSGGRTALCLSYPVSEPAACLAVPASAITEIRIEDIERQDP